MTGALGVVSAKAPAGATSPTPTSTAVAEAVPNVRTAPGGRGAAVGRPRRTTDFHP